jgi:hypothetical protein
MNDLLSMLSGGDIRSDGEADRVAEIVLGNPHMIEDLVQGLAVTDEVVRGRSTHALEKIARIRPEWLLDYLDWMIELSKDDPLPMVRWHLAMIFADMAGYENRVDDLVDCLTGLLLDSSVFVRSWTISSLCIIARLYPAHNAGVTQQISKCREDPSTAIRARVRKALEVLTDPDAPMPKGWVKSERLEV